jgi:hypothetical protein
MSLQASCHTGHNAFGVTCDVFFTTPTKAAAASVARQRCSRPPHPPAPLCSDFLCTCSNDRRLGYMVAAMAFKRRLSCPFLQSSLPPLLLLLLLLLLFSLVTTPAVSAESISNHDTKYGSNVESNDEPDTTSFQSPGQPAQGLILSISFRGSGLPPAMSCITTLFSRAPSTVQG